MGDRGLSEDMEAAIVAELVRPVLLYKGTFAEGLVRVWTGIGPIVWEGEEYTGLGELIGASGIEETDELKANGITLSLRGVKPSDAALALSQVSRSRNKPGALWLALLTEEEEIIPDPWPLFRGRLDAGVVEDGSETAILSINYEHEMATLERPVETRYTHEEQTRRFPGDLGLEYIASLQNKPLRWGSTK